METLPLIPTLLFCVFIRITNIQLGYHNRFLTDETLSEKTIVLRRVQKPGNSMDSSCDYKNHLFLYLVSHPDATRNRMVESTPRFFCNALHRWINSQCCIPISSRCSGH